MGIKWSHFSHSCWAIAEFNGQVLKNFKFKLFLFHKHCCVPTGWYYVEVLIKTITL